MGFLKTLSQVLLKYRYYDLSLTFQNFFDEDDYCDKMSRINSGPIYIIKPDIEIMIDKQRIRTISYTSPTFNYSIAGFCQRRLFLFLSTNK